MKNVSLLYASAGGILSTEWESIVYSGERSNRERTGKRFWTLVAI